MSKTSTHILINTLGTYLNIAFSLIFVFLLTRLMGRVEYGALSVLLSIIYVSSNIMEFGTTTTIYSTMPDIHTHMHRAELATFIKSILYYQTILTSMVIVLLIVLLPLLDRYFFKTHASTLVLTLTAISMLGFVWQNTIQNMLFAAQLFIETNIWLNVSNIVRVVFVFALYFWDQVSILSIIIIFGIVGPLVFLISIIMIHRDLAESVWHARPARHAFKLRYTLTNFIAQQFFNVGLRMDLFILSYFGLSAQVGDYSISQKIILSIISVVISITQVLSPTYTLIKSKAGALKELKHSLLYLMFPTAIFVLVVLTPTSLFELVFTAKFIETPSLSRALAAAFTLFSLGQVFSLSLLYTFKKTTFLLVTNGVFCICVISGCLILIPRVGTLGAPLSLAGAFILITVIQGYVWWREYGKLP